ncbi:hypothetical protein D9758_013142 [Tetrapyrgos nigripes]|uniref:Uncharacterized protein n=1 Tax=Tetrapyrgos nigripes TaxID=182062 RepID=A0A8H5CE96_9AGAR|nr:hypothetical protein D9758_013142 [Tetrapyrgos nigripes]
MNPTQSDAAKTTQPQAAIQMSVVNPAQPSGTQQEQEHNHHQHKVSRLRGGGAGKDYSDVSFVLSVVRAAATASQTSFVRLSTV